MINFKHFYFILLAAFLFSCSENIPPVDDALDKLQGVNKNTPGRKSKSDGITVGKKRTKADRRTQQTKIYRRQRNGRKFRKVCASAWCARTGELVSAEISTIHTRKDNKAG